MTWITQRVRVVATAALSNTPGSSTRASPAHTVASTASAAVGQPVAGGSRSSASSSTVAPESINVMAAIARSGITLLVARNVP